MLTKGLLAVGCRGLGGCVLGIVILCYIVENAGTQTEEVIVHITDFPAVVTIDGRVYRVSNLYDSPIVCELRRGRHELRMWRGGRLVYRETFQVRPGENTVLTAWERPTDTRAGGG